jgi:hypothetical protein
MPIPAENAMTRIQIELTEGRVRELNDLMVRCGLSTKKDLFNNALSIFEWAVEEVASGNVVAAVNKTDQRYEVLRMPVLDTVAKRAPRSLATDASLPPPRPTQIKMAT